MADIAQLERLWHSVHQNNHSQEWNQWREQHPALRINLRNVNLSRADLTEANFYRADLANAHLRDAVLTRAHLGCANLVGADLRRARLTGTNLSGANLSAAHLKEADLTQADIRDAHFDGAQLCGADLRDACLDDATFFQTNVIDALVDARTFTGINTRGLIGLKHVRYAEPVPALQPLAASTRTVAPRHMHTETVFISYARVDSRFADVLEQSVQAAGFKTRVDRDRGHQWLHEIEAVIDACAIVLVVLSPESMESVYVGIEYHYAHRQNKMVIPLDYRRCQIPQELGAIHTLDFRTVPYEQSVQRLLSVLWLHFVK